MMTQAFYSGLSGIKSNQTAIDISSNNIANISTVGYRGYTTEFASIYEKSINTTTSGPTTDSVGVGARVNASAMDQTEGSLSISEKSTDLALYGEGWFGVSDGINDLYTRAGNFSFDANSSLVTSDGMHVMGTMGNNIFNDTLTEVLNEIELGTPESQEFLQFPSALEYPAVATQKASFFANIGVNGEEQTMSGSIVDANGDKNTLSLTFTPSQEQDIPGMQWDVVASVTNPDTDEIIDTQEGVVNFGSNGALDSTTLTTIDNNGTQVQIDLGTGFDGVRASSAEASSGYSVADGSTAGTLNGYEINRNAEVIATFSNGKQSSVGKIAVYHFQNDQGLDRVDSTKFRVSSNSGEAIFYQDENGKNILGAEVINYQLENSNVQMDTALTELIIYQRSFDASSKLITTADEMIQKAINMSQ